MSCLLFPNYTWIFYSLLRLDLIVAPLSLKTLHTVPHRSSKARWAALRVKDPRTWTKSTSDFWWFLVLAVLPQCKTPPRLQPANCCWAPKVRQMLWLLKIWCSFICHTCLFFNLAHQEALIFVDVSPISSYHPVFTGANIDHIDHFHLICDWRIGSHQSSPKPWGQMGVSNTEFSIQNFDHIWRVRARSTDPPRPYELGAFPYPLNQWFMESLMYKMISQNDVWITMSLKVSWK